MSNAEDSKLKSGKRKFKDFRRINSVKLGGGPHGGRRGPHTCKNCGTVHGFRVCPFCHEARA